MTCSDVQRVLPEVIDDPRNGELQTHLESCPACSDLVSELTLIASEARQIGEADEPPPRLWLAIAAELRAEGLIREPKPQPVPVAASADWRSRWSAWWLVPVAAAALIAGGYVVNHRPGATEGGNRAAVNTPANSSPAVQPTGNSAPDTQMAKNGAAKNANPVRVEPRETETSSEDQQFLQVVSTRSPRMKTTYENELRAVNAYIHDAKAYVDQHPGDEDARQHLMDAYEQKAMLYQMALDHIQ